VRPTAASAGHGAKCARRTAEIPASARSQTPRVALASSSAARRGPANRGAVAATVAVAAPLATGTVSVAAGGPVRLATAARPVRTEAGEADARRAHAARTGAVTGNVMPSIPWRR